MSEEEPESPPYAFIGVRSCDLHAIAIQDRVLMEGEHPDPVYRARREEAFIVAVNCTVAGGTCFCVSMETGPRAERGLRPGADRGDRATAATTSSSRPAASAAPRCWRSCRAGEAGQAERRGRRRRCRPRRRAAWAASWTPTASRSCSTDNYEHPRWDEVAERCLTCGNCTMVCPTCFCTTVEDVTDLAGDDGRAHAASGTPASRWTSPTSTAAACARRRSRATGSG